MSVTAAKGFAAAGVRAGIRRSAKDLAVVRSTVPAVGAAMWTVNQVLAAPVVVSKEHLAVAEPQAIVINSGVANAATGERGELDALATAAEAGRLLDLFAEEVLVLSTGVIGTLLPLEKVLGGLRHAVPALSDEGGPDVARRDQAAPDGEQMRDEADREAERLLDLGRVLVRADLVGRDVLEHRGRVRRGLQGPPSTRDPRLGVDDHSGRVDRAGERRERQQHGGGVAAGIRDQRAVRRKELRDRVVPVAERRGVRVLESVPRRVERGLCQPVRAREIDDSGLGRSRERGSPLVVEAPEDELCAGAGSVRIRNERRHVAVQAWVESARRLTGERIRAEGDERELRVR